MGFVVPLFLIGSLAIALPFWLHRLQTKSSDRKAFSSAMLLESSERQMHVKKELRYLLLLTMRVALLMLLALAFAEPYWIRPPLDALDTAAGTHVVVVDASASMGRSGVFEQALAEARRAIRGVPSDAPVQLFAADSTLRNMSELSVDKAAPLAALANISTSAQRLDYGQLAAAVDRYVGSLPQPVTLHFISDFQISGMPTRFEELISAEIAAYHPRRVGTGNPVNWSVEFARQTATGVDVSVSSTMDSDRVIDIDLQLNGERQAPQSVTGAGRHLVHYADLALVEGDNRVAISLADEDDLGIDNQHFVVLKNDPPAPVPLITPEPRGLAVTYLAAALESAARGAYEVEPVAITDFDARVLTRYRWVVLDDLGAVSQPLADGLAEFVRSGGGVLAFAGERSLSLEALPLTGHVLKTGSVSASPFLAVGTIDTYHPILTGTDGWHRVKVSRTIPVNLLAEDQVLIRLENDDPLLVEQTLGAGHVLLILSGADNRWNDLPLHPVFVSFIVETAAYLSGVESLPVELVAGASLPLAVTGAAAGQVLDPDGRELLSLADTARAQQIKLDQPGIYEVYTPQGQKLVAVNVDPRESRLEPMSAATLARWQEATTGADNRMASDVVSIDVPPLELWRWLLPLLALLVVGESVLGNRYVSTQVRTD